MFEARRFEAWQISEAAANFGSQYKPWGRRGVVGTMAVAS
jgi:hypothetical protein